MNINQEFIKIKTPQYNFYGLIKYKNICEFKVVSSPEEFTAVKNHKYEYPFLYITVYTPHKPLKNNDLLYTKYCLTIEESIKVNDKLNLGIDEFKTAILE